VRVAAAGIFLCAFAGCVEYGDPIQPPAPRAMTPSPLQPGYELGLLPPSAPPPAVASSNAAPELQQSAASPLNPAAPSGAMAASDAPAEAPPPAPPPGSPPPDLPLLGTAQRPELDPAVAQMMTLRDYLAQSGDLIGGLERDNWDPSAGGGDVLGFTPDFRVAASGGTHTSVQAAISQAVSEGGSVRRYIQLAAGTYREVVCVPSGAPPITLYGLDADATRTVIAFDNYSGKAKAAGTPANPCNASLTSTTFGTSGSATFASFAAEFQAKNLSFVNDTDETTATGGLQAVALMAQGDRQIFENVRVLGNQDSLFLKTPDVTTVQRAYFKDCYVEGDTDFIFGRSTFVLDGCTIRSLTSRTPNGVVVAPSTDSRNPFGILITRSRFEADATAGMSSTSLGRAWDESQVDVPTYTGNVQRGVFPNGQAVVRESTLGAHIQVAGPWRAAATTSRPYSSVDGAVPANRFYEFQNSGPGSAPVTPP